MARYTVKELFRTVQGEGGNSGRVAVFCRFTGCNLWSGREEDRVKGKGGCSKWCDTDFVGTNGEGGGTFESATDLARAVHEAWGPSERGGTPLVVCTGGEPLLQLDNELVRAFHDLGFEVAVETNGTIEPPKGIDWLCVSPKANATMVVREGQELKIVVPQSGVSPEDFEDLDFDHWFVQPLDGPQANEALNYALDYCHRNPRWRLSLQTHKYIGVP